MIWPDFATDANAVMPHLDKYPDVEITRTKADGWVVSIMDVTRTEDATETGIIAEAWEDTIARAACIAMIKANRKKKS